MNFNKHSELKGGHAIFSASQPSWLRYNDEQVYGRIHNQYRTQLGTELHEVAASHILMTIKPSSVTSLKASAKTYIFKKYWKDDKEEVSSYGMKLIEYLDNIPEIVFDTIIAYIKDAIGYRMTPEQILYYSPIFFGTADTIRYDDKKKMLRIHDLKTGAGKPHMEQLEIYAAYFCLEYKKRPGDIDMELRIYQNGDVDCHVPLIDDIAHIMDRIISINKSVIKEV